MQKVFYEIQGGRNVLSPRGPASQRMAQPPAAAGALLPLAHSRCRGHLQLPSGAHVFRLSGLQPARLLRLCWQRARPPAPGASQAATCCCMVSAWLPRCSLPLLKAQQLCSRTRTSDLLYVASLGRHHCPTKLRA